VTWTPAQLAIRAEWGLDELDTDPRNLRTVDPMPHPVREAAAARPVQPATAEELEAIRARFLREVPVERARVALLDPDGEREAVAPISQSRARATVADAVAAARLRSRIVTPRTRGDRLPDGRALLDALGADPSRDRGTMRCPAHEDRSPSLSWRLTPEGRALVHCHAGCSFAAILEAVR